MLVTQSYLIGQKWQGRGDTKATSETEGSRGIMMVNTESIPIKSSMDTTQHANLMHTFILKTWSAMREINPQNDLTFLQICSKRNEIMVAPDKDYFLIVIQNLTESILLTPCIIPLIPPRIITLIMSTN